MQRLGLALSGGGFRAALYHLGVIRFLRDAELLDKVTCISAVSGGSVLGAHLALNWDRYCGTDEEFQAVTDEVMSLLQMDVRNRIVRRFPLASLANMGRRLFRRPQNRLYTRAGLLEDHYKKFLYGDTSLFSLPKHPRLYILATNLSEGSLCAFHRDGLLLQRREPDRSVSFEQIHMGLATVPMAVAASSAFPGFFPPLELQGYEVGAKEGEFNRHSFTDGGIYDNLGLRMIRHIQNRSIHGGSKADVEGLSRSEFDAILVSNAGASFKVKAEGRHAGGLLSTSLRASEILMDRVNQMELESFHDATGILFFPITRVIQPEQDPYAPHPEIQRHAALIRTDMDAFSDLEVTALIQHGYCVARQSCRERGLISSEAIPKEPPWNPLAAKRHAEDLVPLTEVDTALPLARDLQKSSARRILSTLFSLRDWPTYVWVPLIALVMMVLPYAVYNLKQTSTYRGYVLTAISETSPVYRKILDLIQTGPHHGLKATEYQEVTSLEPSNMDGFEVLSDNRIFDLRVWTADAAEDMEPPYVYSRIHARRLDSLEGNNLLRIQTRTTEPKSWIACRDTSLKPRYRRMTESNGSYLWELELDLSRVPRGGDAEFVMEAYLTQSAAEQFDAGGRFQFSIQADTSVAEIWILMPEGRIYEEFEITGWPIDSPGESTTVVPSTRVDLPIGSILTFKLIDPKPHYRYECQWRWIDDLD